MIYFDSGATTLRKPPEVARAVLRAMEQCASPGRGGHEAAMAAAEAVYDCRVRAAALFDAEPEQIVFTMNATHALNMAIRTLISPGDRVLISGFEHNAVVRPLYALGAETVIAGRTLFDPEDTLEAFRKGLDSGARAVICTHISNVFGYILPIGKIAALCRERGVPLIVDASQSAGMLPVSLKRLGASFIAMPGHKGLYGPQGTGILICGEKPYPLMQGGSGSVSASPRMPDFLPDAAEAGTHNVCGIAGLAAGLEFVRRRGIGKIERHELRLRKALERRLREDTDAILFSGPAQSGVLSFLLPGEDCEETAGRLAEQGIAVRAGLHCAPTAHESAGTLETGTVRVSFSAFNTMTEVETFAGIIKNMRRDGI